RSTDLPHSPAPPMVRAHPVIRLRTREESVWLMGFGFMWTSAGRIACQKNTDRVAVSPRASTGRGVRRRRGRRPPLAREWRLRSPPVPPVLAWTGLAAERGELALNATTQETSSDESPLRC